MKKSFLFFVAIVPVFFVWANSDITNTEDITYNCSTRELRVNFQVGGSGHSIVHNQYRYYDVGGGATVCLTSKPSVCRTFSCPNVCPATTELLNFTALATVNNAGTIATVTSEGLGYTTAPLVTVTGGTCTKLPVATAVVKNKKVQSISLVGGKCTVAPLLTIAPPPVGTTVTGYIDGVINTIFPPPPLKPTGDYWNTCGVLGDIYMTGYVTCNGGPGAGKYTYRSAAIKVTYDRSQCQTYGCTGTKASNALLCPAWKETEKKVFPYTSTHTLQDLVIPADVSRIKVKLWGAGGGSETWTSYGIGGPGGYTEAVIPVTPGETLKVLVGQGGSSGCLNNISVNPIGRSAYGFGGSDACDGGGGGLTGIFRTSAATINKNDRNTALSIAGGGGGSVTNNPGTAHGGSGNDTVHAGGQPDMAGRDDIAPIVSTGSGGGGYAGGGLQTRGGNKGHSAGEGGSGFVIGTAYSQKIEFTPEFTIQTPPNTGDADYVTNVGSGGKATSGGPGRAVVYFLKSANSFDNEGNFSAPVNYTKRDNINGCTDAIKCEWYCPTATPFYCESANTCVTSQNECGQTNTCKTSAPSEIKKELDVPFIQCDAINTTDSHFRYKITKTGGTASDTYVSPLFTVGTSVKHPTTFYAGTYTVTCLYGTAANTNATLPDYGMTAGTCTKTMTANDTANGCSRIYPYRGATLSDELTSASAFDASFRCGSREPVANTTDTKAYRLQVATGDPSFLAYDRSITDLFAGLAIGPVSTQTQNYNFNTGADITCAAKVGDGYSTNPSCQARACVGGACATPQSFIVVPSEEVTCTNQDSISYDVGCNPASPDYTECLQWMYQDNSNSTVINGVTTYTRNAKIKVNNIEQTIYFTCKIETPPGALGPVKTCSIQLPTGGTPVTIFAGDATTQNNTTNYSFQTTAYTLRKDTGKPTGTITYYTNYSNGVTLSQDQYEYWQKQPITAVITCTDKAATSATGEPTTAGETDGSGCACSQTLTHTSNNPNPTAAEQAEIDQWSLGIPSSNTNIGPDVMTYSRVIANMNNATTTAPAVKVQDSANNKSTQSFQPDFGIDSTAPKLVATKTANSVTLAFTDNHVGASGFWKPASAFNETLPAGVLRGTTVSNNAILYRIGPKTNLASLEFGADCSPLPVKNTNYYKYKEVPAAPGTQTLTLSSFDVNNNIVAYCVQDNAGNINRGYYPNNLMGCFASTAMPTIPTLSPSTLSSHYAPLLKTKFASTTLSNNEKYGYSFSESPANASCFRGILSNNITTLVTNQLNPRPAGEVTLTNWTTQLSTIKNTTTPNTNGYYYYSFSANTNNTVTVTPPTGTGTKNVIVDGGNIQINSNIEYTGSGKTLLLIARKNNAGQGGNIYINPTVTRIDAIIIADGGTVMNGTTTSGVTTTKNWISNASDLTNRLTINGRLYSYNTRGGSITPQATPGTDFDPITGNIGKYFDTNSTNATQLITNASPTQAATYDLERLRVMLSDGNSQCTTQVNYQAFTTASLPALLTRPASYQGGNCSF